MSKSVSITAQAADFTRETTHMSAIAQAAVSELMETARQMVRLKQFTTADVDPSTGKFIISSSLEQRVTFVIRSETEMRINNLRKSIDQMRECYARLASIQQSMKASHPAHETVSKCAVILRCHRQTLALRASCVDALLDFNAFDSRLGDTLIASWVYEPYMIRNTK